MIEQRYITIEDYTSEYSSSGFWDLRNPSDRQGIGEVYATSYSMYSWAAAWYNRYYTLAVL